MIYEINVTGYKKEELRIAKVDRRVRTGDQKKERGLEVDRFV